MIFEIFLWFFLYIDNTHHTHTHTYTLIILLEVNRVMVNFGPISPALT